MLITNYDIEQVFKFLNIKPYEQFKIYNNKTEIVLKNKYCLSNSLDLYKVDKGGVLHSSVISFLSLLNGEMEIIKKEVE